MPRLLSFVMELGMDQSNVEVQIAAVECRFMLPCGSLAFYRHTMEHMRYLGLEERL